MGSGLLSYYCFHHLVDLVHKEDNYDVPVNHEVTHHGPTKFNQPSIFIEIGSTELGWRNETGGKIVAQAILNVCYDLSQKHFREGKLHKNDVKIGSPGKQKVIDVPILRSPILVKKWPLMKST